MYNSKVKEVFDRHIKAVKERNLDAIARDYSEDAVFITVTRSPEGTLDKSIIKGRDAIKAAFDAVFTKILPPGSSMEFTNEIVEEDIGYITWSAKSNEFIIPTATDTFVIRDGKIVVQTGFTILDSIK